MEPWVPGGSGLLKVDTNNRVSLKKPKATQAGFLQSAARDGCLPVRHGRGDVSVIESSMPGKQDYASVAKHTVEKQLRGAQQQQQENEISQRQIIREGRLTKHTLDGITVT